ncbi:unnamed protein product [Paramecium primaurelia]|uniref:non-specific serine/threonine protein kinase n=1 Tax=Paramecium primaurelia TaxID=5886 RepID=A0A8S1KWJ4_PARPR|nr:unnamed protein product [Paramecium primaurelia]
MDHFERIRKIGKGNFGDVLLVQRKSDGKEFALKRVDLSMRESFVVDPLNEVKVLKSLDHTNIIKHYDSFVHNNKLCILMEYADNADLSLKIKEAKQNKQFIQESTILAWLTQLAVALDYLHSQKILHRDIKVQNIFLCNDGIVKLGDFGISRTLENTSELAQTSIGTPFYLSPELCQNQSYNHKIDIWMLGCAIYELCTLQKPFTAESINALATKIINEQHTKISDHYSEFLSNLIDEMLQKQPEKRPEISKILSFPQIQIEIQKLSKIYQSTKISYLNKGFSSSKKNNRMQQNSIHFLVEKSKQQQGQSPISSRRSQSKVNTPYQGYKTDIIDQNSPNFKLNGKLLASNLHTLPDYIDDQQKTQTPISTQRTESNEINSKHLKYQKSISINTQIDDNNNKRNQEIESQPTLIKNQKSFTFVDLFFNPNTPTSPNRSLLLTDFLKRKLGNEKFYQMKILLEQNNDPIKLLDQEKGLVQDIIGEQNMDCVRIFKLLISCSITPQASHGRAKSAQVFTQEKQETLIDIIKESDFQPSNSIGSNPGLEISFKNLQNFTENQQSEQYQLKE